MPYLNQFSLFFLVLFLAPMESSIATNLPKITNVTFCLQSAWAILSFRSPAKEFAALRFQMF